MNNVKNYLFGLLLFLIFACCCQDKKLFKEDQSAYDSSMSLIMLNSPEQESILYSIDSCILINDKCGVFCVDTSVDNYYEISSFTNKISLSNNDFVLFKKTTYNEDYYILVNLQTCEQLVFNGEPQITGNYILAFNENSTTDNKNYIDLWFVKTNGDISFVRQIEIPETILPQTLRYNKRYILMKDLNSLFWSFEL